ncbi:DUF6248 family natural product biosynthesis protein [Streptomyces sp. OUCMDZ-3434]|uniref:DUF6248 family natural product biosynthesis protein n=1 Tax=Streptomyces sp. OUCMDZ-3434 TaxID=1535304 RepID=UPI003FCCD467
MHRRRPGPVQVLHGRRRAEPRDPARQQRGVAKIIVRPDDAPCVWWCRCPSAKDGPAPARPARRRRRSMRSAAMQPKAGPAQEDGAGRPDRSAAPHPPPPRLPALERTGRVVLTAARGVRSQKSPGPAERRGVGILRVGTVREPHHHHR